MRYRKLSLDGDYVFGGSERDFYRDVPEAVGQAVETRLLLFLAEWYLDLSEGTPYLQGILGKHSQETANSVIQDRILGTIGLLNIQNYQNDLNPDSRDMSVSCTVNTIYGVTDIEVLNFSNI